MAINLAEDPQVVAFRNAYEAGEFNLNTDKFITEIQNMHITRKVRVLRADEILQDLNKLIDALMQNQGIRSRITEIRMKCMSVSTNLNYKIETIMNYLQVRYREELKSLKGTQAERKAFLMEIFSFTTPAQQRLQVLQSYCELVINDIDQASWCLKAVIECVKMSDEVKKNIV